MHPTERMTAHDFVARLAEPEAMEERRDDSTPGRRESDRSAFHDPRFILQILALLISVAGGMTISWVVSQTRTTALESAAANLNEKANRIESQMAGILASVNAATIETRSLQTEVNAKGREIQDLKDANKMLEARIISLERGLARQEARSP